MGEYHGNSPVGMTCRSLGLRLLAIVVGVFSIPVLGFAANPVEDAVGRCSTIADSERRLQCFDDVAASLKVTADAPKHQLANEAVMADVDQEMEPSATKHERFGKEMLPESMASRTQEMRRITAEIVGITRAPRGEFVFELSNGQSWVQISPRRYDYRIGMPVTIERSALGSYTLATDQGGATRVRRVR
jgi:hypothetical protein